MVKISLPRTWLQNKSISNDDDGDAADGAIVCTEKNCHHRRRRRRPPHDHVANHSRRFLEALLPVVAAGALKALHMPSSHSKFMLRFATLSAHLDQAAFLCMCVWLKLRVILELRTRCF